MNEPSISGQPTYSIKTGIPRWDRFIKRLSLKLIYATLGS